MWCVGFMINDHMWMQQFQKYEKHALVYNLYRDTKYYDCRRIAQDSLCRNCKDNYKEPAAFEEYPEFEKPK